jgi:hypothetical protein
MTSLSEDKHQIKVAVEVRMPDSNCAIAVLQERLELNEAFSFRLEPRVFEAAMKTVKKLPSVQQRQPFRLMKGHITYWTKFDPHDIHGLYHTIPVTYRPEDETPPARQNGPNGPGTYSIQYVVYLLNFTYNGDPIEHICRAPYELVN